MTVIFSQCDQNIKDLSWKLRKNLGVRGTLSVQPLITSLGVASSIKQCWFADDACGAGSILEIKKWWDTLNTLGPDLRYFPNAKKC